MARPRLATYVMAPALMASMGCTEPVDCTTEAVTSVTVTVVDEDDNRVRTAEVTYSANGGAPVACDSPLEGLYQCGSEVEGELTITATARGYIDAVEQVTVASDECHVIGETLDIVLEEDECLTNFRPSVLVGVTGKAGGIPAGTAVFWTPDTVWDACEGPDGKGLWSCGLEVDGALIVEASATGHETATQKTEVLTDGCHVMTERLDFVLQPK